MARTIKVATTQMDLTPAPTKARLTRASSLVAGAADQGAQLVLLPEVFNTGYAYLDDNYRRAETLNGPTVTWMRQTAAQYNVHLGGTLLLLDQDEVYNAFLLFAPDGQRWRYDKNYPWGWERAYFRDAHRITVADTNIGRFGMLICWDMAHPTLWKRYVGQVDMMLNSASPPNMGQSVYHFRDGTHVGPQQIGSIAKMMQNDGGKAFHDIARTQSAWLGVPTLCSGIVGHFESPMPCGHASLTMMLPSAPWLARYLAQADTIRITSDALSVAYALNAAGDYVAQLTPDDGETFTIAEVTLPAQRHTPTTPQPKSTVSWASYFVSDLALPAITKPTYRKKLREMRSERMAPVDANDQRWRALVGTSGILALLVGMLLGRRKQTQ